MDDNKIVCNCIGITIGDIRKSVENGAKTFEEVQEEIAVSTVCGNCLDYAENVFKEILKGK